MDRDVIVLYSFSPACEAHHNVVLYTKVSVYQQDNRDKTIGTVPIVLAVHLVMPPMAVGAAAIW